MRHEPAVSSGPQAGGAPTVAFLDLLLTVGYIDGLFHQREHQFVRQFLDSVVTGVDPSLQAGWRAHFDEAYARLSGEVSALGAEVVATTDGGYVATRLKVRAVTVFRTLSAHDQAIALELIQGLIHADGMVTRPEHDLFAELLAYFNAAPAVTAPAAAAGRRPIELSTPQWNPLRSYSHPLLDPLEQTYSPHPVELRSQVARDWHLIDQAIKEWNRQRALGRGALTGITDVGSIPVGARALDGHVHVMRPRGAVELVVLGDLHGCYGCFKAALLQSDFINRVWLHQWDPTRHPDIKLVLLGDYIDRGRFSFDGVLRAVLQLLVAMPDHVIALRGNHETFLWHQGRLMSGVHPAEGLASILPHVGIEMLDAYRVLFENMPSAFLFERMLFVHGGIPRDDTFAERYRDLSSLNDATLRFQMMWSDPGPTDHVPVELQRQSPRFTFGRKQFAAFMERTGCQVMVRGHEQIERGFEVIYDLGERMLINLFSAGGHHNVDLPVDSPYRSITPMAMTVSHAGETTRVIPWPIDYGPFNYETCNGLHRRLPLLEFRTT